MARPFTSVSPFWQQMICIVIGLVALHLYLDYVRGEGSATWVMVNAECQLDSKTARIKAERQGARFWRDQLRLVDSTINAPMAWIERSAKLDAILAPQRAKRAMVVDSLYAEHPALRPTAAEELRDIADSLDARAVNSMVFDALMERSLAVQRCRDVVAAMAGAP